MREVADDQFDTSGTRCEDPQFVDDDSRFREAREEFEDVTDLVELRPIPSVILNVYKRIFK